MRLRWRNRAADLRGSLMSVMEHPRTTPLPARAMLRWAIGPVVGIGVLWAYWPTLVILVRRWAEEPRYSHGFVVPLLALVVWWARRWPVAGSGFSWWGLPVLAAAATLRLLAGWFFFDWFDGVSLLLVLAGFALLSGGRPLFRQVGPAIALLVFMLPFPFAVEGMLSVPLQRLATVTSTYFLQTFGLPAVAEGNIICIDDLRIGVLEACNGLGMLSAFFAISTTVALIIRRPLADRLVIFLSAIPIGVLMNLLRITATGVVYGIGGSQAARTLFHEMAGWLMMPFALLALWMEVRFLDWIFVPVSNAPAPPAGGRLNKDSAPA
jgi:exosortase